MYSSKKGAKEYRATSIYEEDLFTKLYRNEDAKKLDPAMRKKVTDLINEKIYPEDITQIEVEETISRTSDKPEEIIPEPLYIEDLVLTNMFKLNTFGESTGDKSFFYPEETEEESWELFAVEPKTWMVKLAYPDFVKWAKNDLQRKRQLVVDFIFSIPFFS